MEKTKVVPSKGTGNFLQYKGKRIGKSIGLMIKKKAEDSSSTFNVKPVTFNFI
jgi:hypothetical protein